MRPICVRCQRFYRPKKNGTPFIEMMPYGSSHPEPGTADPDSWQPYKLWNGDLWECHGCGHELIVGVAKEPMAEHYQNDFNRLVASTGAETRVNDC